MKEDTAVWIGPSLTEEVWLRVVQAVHQQTGERVDLGLAARAVRVGDGL